MSIKSITNTRHLNFKIIEMNHRTILNKIIIKLKDLQIFKREDL